MEGEYHFTLSAYRGEERLEVQRWWGVLESESLSLGTLYAEPRARRAEAPPLSHPLTGEWSGTVRLLGYNAEPAVASASQPVRFQLAWKAIAPTAQPQKVFLQLLDEQGRFVAGKDAFFDVPSTAWQEGEVLLSDHLFEAGSIPPGRYTIITGLYNESTGERVPVDAPNNALPLGTLEVVP
jgi:hypothetical protein